MDVDVLARREKYLAAPPTSPVDQAHSINRLASAAGGGTTGSHAYNRDEPSRADTLEAHLMRPLGRHS
jgi:hypothetical protein